MKKPVIHITITKEDVGYSAHALVHHKSINTEADSFEELKENILDVVNLSFQDEGFIYNMDEINIVPDLESFFDFYKVIDAKALSHRIGIDQKLLAEYINGEKKPSQSQTKKIFQGVQQLGRELAEIHLF